MKIGMGTDLITLYIPVRQIKWLCHWLAVFFRCCWVLFCLLQTSEVFAAAGDNITNIATIDYKIAGVKATATASTSFIEDRLINFIVSKINDGIYDPVIAGMNGALMSFSVLNTGNSSQDFLLAAVNTTPNPFSSLTDSFNAQIPMRVFVESGVTPGYQAAQDTATYIDELAPNTAITVYVVANIPAGLTNNEVAAVALIAQVAQGGRSGSQGNVITHDSNGHISPASPPSGYSNGATSVSAGSSLNIPDTNGMDTVFNDPAGKAAEDVSSSLVQDIAANGQHADAGAFRVTPPVSIKKTVTVIDSTGGSDPRPGAILRYQLDVTVLGNNEVNHLVIHDDIPAHTSYTDASISLNGIAQSDADDAPVDFSRAININSKPVTAIEVDLSHGGFSPILPGVTNKIIFEVTIN